jgi:hypothetical protein
MTPKEKAEELIEKFDGYTHYAIYAVNEILSDYKNYLLHENTEYKGLMYWNEVKSEIEKL